MSVDARARVPTAVGLPTVVHLHHHLVLAIVIIQIGRDVHREWRIAVAMLTSLLSVHEDLSPLIDTLEVQLGQPTLFTL